MKFWKWIELGDKMNNSKTAEGLSFWEKEVHGWNDNETLTDVASLVKIRAVESPSEPGYELHVEYTRPELQKDLMIDKLVDQAKSDLLAQVTARRF